MASDTYRPEDYGTKEEELIRMFKHQVADAREHFENVRKPQLDRAHKLYVSWNGDRATELKKLGQIWQANIFVPYIHAVVETLMPRILDARPEFTASARRAEDDFKGERLRNLTDYTWEKCGGDDMAENVTRSSLVYGMGYIQVSYKKDVREHEFLITKDLAKKKYKYAKREQVFYDAPFAEWVDNYSLWYDWHNIPRASKQYWFKRLVLSGGEIKRRYPNADKKRLKMAFKSGAGDITDYASVRNTVKRNHESIYKGADNTGTQSGYAAQIYRQSSETHPDLKMYEVFECWWPFLDRYAVMVAEVPILKGGWIPNPYDFKETPFIDVPYLRLPNEFEGMGLPLILENPQLILNMIKNQRLDATTLNIHKMWIVNPMANIDKKDLVTRPFGIIYSPDPQGVREVQFTDVKASAFKEEELLKNDLRYASGVDDFSMGVGGGAGSATEVRHLRESTLERVRLFTNHLGSAFGTMMRYWMCMYRQFFTKDFTIRITGDDGLNSWPLIQKDDLMGEFDYKSSVIPSIAGKNDIDKKQGMDLFQLLISLPFVDPMKLTKRVLHHWDWSLESVAKNDTEQQQPPPMAPDGTVPPGVLPPPPEEEQFMMQEEGGLPGFTGSGDIPTETLAKAIKLFGGGGPGKHEGQFGEAGAPINLLKTPPLPPTAAGLPTTNPRGLNRGGNVNTNIPTTGKTNPEASMLNQVNNIQR